MISLTSSKTGQPLGAISLTAGSVTLDPESVRRLMSRLADSEIGHLITFHFDCHSTQADCLFGRAASIYSPLTMKDSNEN